MLDNSRPHLKISIYEPPQIRTFSGGGGGTYIREEYSNHAKKIFKEAQQLEEIFNKSFDKQVIKKRYFRVEVPEVINLLTSEGKKLGAAISADLVGTPMPNIGHFSTPEDSFSDFLVQLKKYRDSHNHTGKSKFSAIDDVGIIPATEKISNSLKKLIDSHKYSGEALISLFSNLAREEQERYKTVIDQYLKSKNGKIVGDATTNSGRVFRIEANPEVINELAEGFLAVQMVDPVSELLTESAVKGDRIEDSVIVNNNDSNAYVCIFDLGVVRNSRFLEGSIIGQDEPIGPPHQNDLGHGTFVASRIIYGNSLRDFISQGILIPDVKIYSVCLKTRDSIGNQISAKGEELLKIIRDTVERMHDKIKVYNLSMNITYQSTSLGALISDDRVGGLAAEIDKLSKKHGVLFILTTGNYPTTPATPYPTTPYPEYFLLEECRITEPAEAMLALTIGSVADRDNDGSIAKKDMPSPFTRSGPGFNQYRKPDLVAQGGNLAQNWRNFPDLSVAGIDETGNYLAYGTGTSYSAPLVSRLAAKIFEQVNNATPDLVRALLIHSSNLFEIENFEPDMKTKLMGNGLPNPQKLLASDRWNQNYTFQGKIGYREKIKIPFYIPKQLIQRKGSKKIRISFTVAFSPDTDRTKGEGYCKSHLSVNLLKRLENNELKKETSKITGDQIIKDRYSTVIRYDKVFSRGIAEGEWELLIEHVSSRCEPTDDSVPYSVVITISDPRQDETVDIYAAIQNEIPNKYENLIAIQERARIRI